MPATRARDRLQRMTGSDSVQLNDSNYMTMLSKKYWEEYEEELDKAEKQRMEAEKNRVRRLMVQGYITPDELHDVEQNSYKNAAAKRQASKKKMKQPSPNPDQSTDLQGSSDSHQKNTTTKTVSMRLSEDDQMTTTTQFTHSHDADDAEQQSQSELQHNGTSNGHNDAHHDDQGNDGRHDNPSPHPKSATPTQTPPPAVKYTPKYSEPMLVQLYNQESVDSLYGMAEQLVPPRNKYKSDSKTSSRKVVIQ